MTLEELQVLMNSTEDEHLEFKEAKGGIGFDKVGQYCSALANEGGGKFILGVSNTKPRKVVGTQTFQGTLDRIKGRLFDSLHFRLYVSEMKHPSGRVVVFECPPRPPGKLVEFQGSPWMRVGEGLTRMDSMTIKRILDETGPDFSAEICTGSTLTDLDTSAIETLRDMWKRKSADNNLANLNKQQLLEDSDLLIDGSVTYAALVLLGTRKALGKYLGCAEVVFEYRSNEATLAAQQRKDFRIGFFLYYDNLWQTINLRNDIQQYHDGLFVWDIPTFNETVVREAILNAISHRDYRLAGSVFVRQYPRKLVIESPGGFPEGVTQHNIFNKQVPRNRRIAEVFSKCGLVERSGQGMDRMYRECIKESKSIPDFTGTDDHLVSLSLHGDIQDLRFLRFLEQVGKERLSRFSTEDFLVIDLIHKEKPVPEHLKYRLPRLLEQEVIERIGHGRGTKYILSRRFYKFLGKKGTYTRTRGLDRPYHKQLLLDHINKYEKEGSPLKDLKDVLPDLSSNVIKKLLQELKKEGHIYPKGRTKGAKWYPGSNPQ